QLQESWTQLRESLISVLEYGETYTQKVLRQLTGLAKDEQPFKIDGDEEFNVLNFGQKANELYGTLMALLPDGNEDTNRHQQIVQMEQDYYRSCFSRQSISAAMPVIYIPNGEIAKNLKDLGNLATPSDSIK